MIHAVMFSTFFEYYRQQSVGDMMNEPQIVVS